jgi:DNA-binding response OmpR family regulator
MPVIMLTSKNQTSDIRAMLEIGAVDYVLKPFTKDIIQERIDVALELSA